MSKLGIKEISSAVVGKYVRGQFAKNWQTHQPAGASNELKSKSRLKISPVQSTHYLTFANGST